MWQSLAWSLVPAVLLCCTYVSDANACSCRQGALVTYPSSSEPLEPEGKLLLEGIGGWSSGVALHARDFLLLSDTGDEIPLRPTRTYEGSTARRAISFAPAKRLVAGAKYRLVARKSENNAFVELHALNGKGKDGKVEWKVGKASKQLAIEKAADLLENSSKRDSCGISSVLRVRTANEADGLVQVTLQDANGDSVLSYPVPVVGGVLELYDGPCDAVLRLIPGEQIRLAIQAFDLNREALVGHIVSLSTVVASLQNSFVDKK